MTASLAMRKTFLRRPRKPLASARTFLWRAWAVTPRLTRGVESLLRKWCVFGRSEAGEWQHLRHVAHVRLVHGDGTTQVALVLRRLLREDVALERLTALDGTARAHPEPLRGALLGLHLGHDCSFFDRSCRRRREIPSSCKPAVACAAAHEGPGRIALFCFLLPLRRQHHHHLPAFELGHVLDDRHR